MKLIEMTCVPCRGGEPKLTEEEIAALLPQVPGWEVAEVDGIQQLRRVYKFKQYLQGLAFTQKVAELAEAQDHHPAILVEWRKVTVSWWTHVVKGLHQNDFISAAKSDALFEQVKGAG
ncbi:MAG: 4a-hydroxytetrahydrobiopterin dehydratase [Anaerolineales bacterium]|jgi:4a-hydroxytetrahydrobiopterin dehydratase